MVGDLDVLEDRLRRIDTVMDGGLLVTVRDLK